MRLTYILIFVGLIQLNSFSQNIQGTISKTGPLEISVFARPATAVNPTSTNASSYNIGLRFLKGALLSAPSVTITSSIGGSLSTIEVVDDGTYYTYEAVANGANFPVTIANTEVELFKAVFSSEASGKFIRLVHDENSNNALFDIVIPGYPSSMNTSMRFYGGGNIDNNPVNGFVEASSPLPIIIKSFSATKDGDRNARLDWSTSLEINSAYFGIERSMDGNTWEAINKVAAAGNSNTEQFYEYVDRDLPLNRSKDQIFYYRLMLVDLDGQYKYSDIRGVNFGKASTDKIISLYPNPAVQMVNLDLSGMDLETGDIHLRVTDMQGRNMIDKTILGNGIEPIEVTQLPAGTYNVAVTQGTTLHQKQFIKID
jgi:hypothetical protein